MEQATSKTSHDDAHDAHEDNDSKTIDRRRRDDGGDDGDDGDDGSCAQAGHPKYPIGVLGNDFLTTADDDDAQQRRRRATTMTAETNALVSAANTRAAAMGVVGLTPHESKGRGGLDTYTISWFCDGVTRSGSINDDDSRSSPIDGLRLLLVLPCVRIS